jgi:hypothetical protein
VRTNKTITPVRLIVTCDSEIDSASGGVMGTGAAMMGGWGGRITTSNKQYGIGILSPAWTPDNPLIVTIYSKVDVDVNQCSFQEQ